MQVFTIKLYRLPTVLPFHQDKIKVLFFTPFFEEKEWNGILGLHPETLRKVTLKKGKLFNVRYLTVL